MTESFLITTFSSSKNVPLHLQNLQPKLAPLDSWGNQPGHLRLLGETEPCLNSERIQTPMKRRPKPMSQGKSSVEKLPPTGH